MTLENVTGNIRITDGSGGITVKGAGSVDVSDVGGNFRAGSNGSGSINWDRVAGQVDVPRRYRR